MVKYFVLKTFKHWLALNGERFRYRPYLSLIRKNYFEFKFQGITPFLHGYINKDGSVEIFGIYRGKCLDIIADFDISVARTPSGQYYCRSCAEPPGPEMFPSREELWIKHAFEPLLEWSNEKFLESQWLCLVEVKDRYSYAEFKDIAEVEKEMLEEGFVHACPVVQSRKSLRAGSNEIPS